MHPHRSLGTVDGVDRATGHRLRRTPDTKCPPKRAGSLYSWRHSGVVVVQNNDALPDGCRELSDISAGISTPTSVRTRRSATERRRCGGLVRPTLMTGSV